MNNDLLIGVLYESNEWSDHKLAKELQEALSGHIGRSTKVLLINMENKGALERALGCHLLISRVFASAIFRDHRTSLNQMNELILAADQAQIPLINPGRAHQYEVSKRTATAALHETGIDTPQIYGFGTPVELQEIVADLTYPCIIKPDCGGRTTYTAILHNTKEAYDFLATAPSFNYLVEEYIEPEKGFITRIEIIDGAPELVFKRSIAANGLSSYHFGSSYEAYPDCPEELLAQATRVAKALEFFFGSFDVIETNRGAFFIDANSVSNVSEDCTELLGIDLMARYAEAIAKLIKQKGW